MIYAKLKEELIATEYKVDVFEQGLLLDEEEAEDIEEIFIENMMNYWISLDQHEVVLKKSSIVAKEPYSLKPDEFCIDVGDGK